MSNSELLTSAAIAIAFSAVVGLLFLYWIHRASGGSLSLFSKFDKEVAQLSPDKPGNGIPKTYMKGRRVMIPLDDQPSHVIAEVAARVWGNMRQDEATNPRKADPEDGATPV